MSTYTEILYQIVFGSKDITKFLDPLNREKLFNYMAGIISNKKCVPYRVGGYGNHVHLIVYLHPSVALADLVRDVKKASHFWMIELKDLFSAFPGWQVGYSAFTYDYSAKANLIRYVKNQAVHHSKKSFEEELVEMLKERGIEFDPKYLFI